MSVRVVADDRHAALYDSTAMLALGPVFSHEDLFGSPEDAAMDFLEWLAERGIDPRSRRVIELVTDQVVWRNERMAAARVAEKRGRGVGA